MSLRGPARRHGVRGKREDRVKDGSTSSGLGGGAGTRNWEPAIADWQEQLQWVNGQESWNPPRAWSQVPP